MGPEKQSVRGPPVQLRRLQRCLERGIRCCVGTWGAWVHTDRHFGNWAKVLSKVCLECVTERHFHNQIEQGFTLTALLQLISAAPPPVPHPPWPCAEMSRMVKHLHFCYNNLVKQLLYFSLDTQTTRQIQRGSVSLGSHWLLNRQRPKPHSYHSAVQ